MVMMALLDMLFGLKTSLLKALYDWMVAHSCFTFSNLLEFFLIFLHSLDLLGESLVYFLCTWVVPFCAINEI